MAKACKRVLYFRPRSSAFLTLNEDIIGDGFKDVEWCDDLWPVKKEVDLFMFPDIGDAGLQLELESQGFPVWGSRLGDQLEINRELFNKTLKEVGLPVAKHANVTGLTNLRSFLKDKKDQYIKISKYRGTIETRHWRDYELDRHWLDSLLVKLGPAYDLIPFLVFPAIETGVEIGGDTYCVDGKWPKLMLHGDEDKDKAYLAAVTPFKDMPDDLKSVMEAFSELLKECRYRNQFSMEDRDGYFIDFTGRGGLPSTGSQLNTWKNFPEIIWAGAHGELVEPIPAHQFSAECIVSLKCSKDEWGKTKVPKELDDALKITGCCEIEGFHCFPPDGHQENEVGWLVAGADTMLDLIDEMNRLAKLLPDGLSAATESLPGLLAKIQAGEKEGMEFSEDEVPEPETALDI